MSVENYYFARLFFLLITGGREAEINSKSIEESTQMEYAVSPFYWGTGLGIIAASLDGVLKDLHPPSVIQATMSIDIRIIFFFVPEFITTLNKHIALGPAYYIQKFLCEFLRLLSSMFVAQQTSV